MNMQNIIFASHVINYTSVYFGNDTHGNTKINEKQRNSRSISVTRKMAMRMRTQIVEEHFPGNTFFGGIIILCMTYVTFIGYSLLPLRLACASRVT